MSAADLTMAVVLASLTAYALLGGADFGAGFWYPLAGAANDDLARARRRLIEHALSPVLEANHAWLIFAIVLLWTGFPGVFASVASTASVPLTAAALGIIGRGSAFAFRKVGEERHQRWYAAVFSVSSVVTPFFFGAVVGGVASGRVPEGVAEGDLWTSWWNPTSIATGLLAIGMCAYLAAVFLLGDASREDPRLVPGLRTRALAASGGFATLAATALPVVNWDAPSLGQELLRLPAAGFVGMAGVAGAVAAGLVATRQFLMARVAAGASAACVIWGWGAARYPTVLPGIGLDAAAADPEVLRALLWSTGVGMVMVLPSLAWLFVVAQRSPAARSGR